jgi:hypothetical protein
LRRALVRPSGVEGHKQQALVPEVKIAELRLCHQRPIETVMRVGLKEAFADKSVEDVANRRLAGAEACAEIRDFDPLPGREGSVAQIAFNVEIHPLHK